MARIDDFLKQMIETEGSDLHLCVGMPPKIRVHGELQELDEPAIDQDSMAEIMEEICPDHKWQDYLETGDADFAYEMQDVARFRCNYFYNHFGKGAVLRVIPSDIKTIDDLALPEVLKTVCEYQKGLVLVTGPTGSGKSTTLAAMIDYINAHYSKHVITIEDPIEFVHTNKNSVIVQREVGSDTNSFQSALKGSMRADPDTILVGELRDLETMSLALTCATMGMLVFGTLHTNNAPKTIDRIIDTFPADRQGQARAMLAQSLASVVSQLLCRKASGKGRIATHEILLSHEALPATIREGRISNIRSIIEGAGNMGMKTMDSDLMTLMNEEKITAVEAYMKASNKEDFEQYIDKSQLEQMIAA